MRKITPPFFAILMTIFIFCRVVYVFGKQIVDKIQDVTPTYLNPHLLGTLRQCDYVANQTLLEYGNCVDYFILYGILYSVVPWIYKKPPLLSTQLKFFTPKFSLLFF